MLKLPKLTRDTQLVIGVLVVLGGVAFWPQLKAWAGTRREPPAASGGDADGPEGTITIAEASRDYEACWQSAGGVWYCPGDEGYRYDP